LEADVMVSHRNRQSDDNQNAHIYRFAEWRPVHIPTIR
jgi:hypothetical protein